MVEHHDGVGLGSVQHEVVCTDRRHSTCPQLPVRRRERDDRSCFFGLDERVAEVEPPLVADQGCSLFGLEDHLELAPEAAFDVEEVRMAERIEHEQRCTTPNLVMPVVSQGRFRELATAAAPGGLAVSDVGCPMSDVRLRPDASQAFSLRLVQPIEVSIEKEWLSVADICDYMGVSAFVVTNVLRTGELPGVKFGREWRVARVDFQDWINAQRAARRRS